MYLSIEFNGHTTKSVSFQMSIIDHHGFNFYSGPVLPVQDISAATFIIHS